MKNLKFFGTDESRESFVIFETEIEDAPNAFFWVTIPHAMKRGKLEIVTVSRLYSFINQNLAQFNVKEEGAEEIIEKALKVIEEYPVEELSEKISEFNDMLKGQDKWGDIWDKLEEETAEGVESARAGDGLWPKEQTDTP